MGCGCRRNRGIASFSSGSNNTLSGVKRTVACIDKYDELTLLDRKAIALYKKFRSTEEGVRYLEIQKNIRKWVVELRSKCPDETELKEYSEFINMKYSENFNSTNSNQ